MKRLLALAFCAALIPCAALAQSTPPRPPGPPGGGPPPQMHARMDKMKADRAAMFAALSPEHRAAVEAAIGQLATGTLASPQDAIKQIDSVLTPSEKTAVLAAHTKAMADMHAMMPAHPGTPAQHARTPRVADAGAVLLGVTHMGMRGGPGFGMMDGRDRHRMAPTPAMRASMMKAHDAAKASALAALSASHRASVQAIVAQLAANKTGDRRAASKAAADKVNALLTASEKTAVNAAGAKMRTAMRANMVANAPAGAPRPHRSMAPRTPNPGRFLISMLMPPRPFMNGGPGMRGGMPGGH